MNIIKTRLAQLRQAMQDLALAAYIIPSADPHASEYLADHWQGRRWISGFTGTAGTVVVTQDDAGLWTDGRYYIQAQAQLEGSGIRLFRMVDPGVPGWAQWLSETLPKGSRVGFDGAVLTSAQAESLHHYGLVSVFHEDLLDRLWHDRPALPDAPAIDHSVAFAGLTSAEKLANVREQMRSLGCDYQLLNSLDDIGWLFNLRGSDTPYCPVVLAHALVGQDTAHLFIDADKLTQALSNRLQQEGVHLHPYHACEARLAKLPAGTTLRLDKQVTNYRLYQAVPATVTIQDGQQITTALKAIKNPVEMMHIQDCLTQDGVAMVRFMRWLDQTVPSGEVCELSAEAYLEARRREIAGYKEPSFRTIAGYEAHGALMHYGATPASNIKVGTEHFFLVDSGGQYPNGTTDITRTFHFGEPSEQARRDYTLVLKAHISLARARFKMGSRGTQIDALARAPLWEQGIDYSCGTGHGVGFFMNVHEGPHSLSQKWIDEPLKPGMTVTIEPGIYRENQYGIRIENILSVVEDITTEFGCFYRFETLTLAPIDTAPVIKALLTPAEIDWLNQYHQRVYTELAPLLNDEEKIWLAAKTIAL